MAKKKKNKSNPLLTDKEQSELQDLINGMLNTASNLFEEYDNLDLTELAKISGSITQVHHDSPFLDELFEGDAWKRVIKNIPVVPETPKEDNDSK